MSDKMVKAYLISRGKLDLNKSRHYGILICNHGKTVYKCDNISNQLHIAQKFVDMVNKSFK